MYEPGYQANMILGSIKRSYNYDYMQASDISSSFTIAIEELDFE